MLPSYEKEIDENEVVITFEHDLKVVMDKPCQKIKKIEFKIE